MPQSVHWDVNKRGAALQSPVGGGGHASGARVGCRSTSDPLCCLPPIPWPLTRQVLYPPLSRDCCMACLCAETDLEVSIVCIIHVAIIRQRIRRPR